MDVYMYQAAMLCEDCGLKVRKELDAAGKAPEDPDDENSYDSDDFPKGPYADGGGEADSPNHCSECGVFLENPLTDDGVEYVEEAIANHLKSARGDAKVLKEWAEFYDIPFPNWSKKVAELAAGHEGKLPAFAWPGGYPIVYYDKDNEPICAACAMEANWTDAQIEEYGTYDEGPAIQCANCNAEIESSYGDPEEEKGASVAPNPKQNAKRGPGKFSDDIDEHLWNLSLDGADEDAETADGWFGILRAGDSLVDDLRANGIELDAEDYEFLSHQAGVILHESTQGFVHAEYYEEEGELERDWREIKEEEEADVEQEG